MEKSSTSKLAALIFGPTGAIGRELVLELLNAPQWETVAVVTRRTLEEWDKLSDDKKAKLKVIKKDTLDGVDDLSKWGDDGKYSNLFCCLGTTRGKDGKAGQWIIDHDYPVNAAKLAKQIGIPNYSIVTSQGADRKSFFSWYLEMKGKTEYDIEQVGLPSLSIFRPGLLLNRRGDERTVEKIFAVVPFISKADVKDVAFAMRREAEMLAGTNRAPVSAYENKDILRIVREGVLPAPKKK